MSTPSAEHDAGSQPARSPRQLLNRPAGQAVKKTLEGEIGLQARFLRGESAARAELAHLRKAVSAEIGDSPAIWHLTSIDIPDNAGDAPTYDEIAVHTALTLYAVHQQSKSEPMHRPGQALGRAARLLVADGNNESLRKRFNALVTSATIGELRRHLKTFASLLRAKGIALDYALLANDLSRFQAPGGPSRVRLAWARQFAFLTDSAKTASSPTTATQTTEN